MSTQLNNCARSEYDPAVDVTLRAELDYAGITHSEKNEPVIRSITKKSEVQTGVMGFWNGWRFTRAWYYWVCEGPGIPFEDAMKLNEKFGKEVRVDGFAGGESPRRFHGLGVGHYHVDTLEGLKALADTIREVVQRHQFPQYVCVGAKPNTARLLRHSGDWAWYYRDAGAFGVRATVKDGKIVAAENIDQVSHLNGTELTECTEQEWSEANKAYLNTWIG